MSIREARLTVRGWAARSQVSADNEQYLTPVSIKECCDLAEHLAAAEKEQAEMKGLIERLAKITRQYQAMVKGLASLPDMGAENSRQILDVAQDIGFALAEVVAWREKQKGGEE